MTLIILLIVLITERVALQSAAWQVQKYLDAYLGLALPKITQKRGDSLSLFLFVAAPAIVFALVLMAFDSRLLNVIVSLLVMAVCIGNNQIRNYYRQYLNAAGRGDEEAQCILQAKLAQEPDNLLKNTDEIEPQNDQEPKPQQLASLGETLIWNNFKYYAVPIFYYVLFGVPGVVFVMTLLYLVETLNNKSNSQLNDKLSGSHKALAQWLEWALWIPSRLVTLGYLFVGHFSNGLETWLRHAANFSVSSQQILYRVASAAEAGHGKTGPEEAQHMVKLAKRNMLLFMVVVALLTLYGQLV